MVWPEAKADLGSGLGMEDCKVRVQTARFSSIYRVETSEFFDFTLKASIGVV